MRLTAWRIFKAKHRRSAFTGEGARLNGGRWNSPGMAVVYAAGSPALAALEMLVHLDAHQLLAEYLTSEVAFDSEQVEDLDRARLPRDWRTSPAPESLRRIGDEWLASGSSLALRVPSVLIESESNFLLNPAHAGFARLTIGKPQAFRFDPRLIKRDV